MLNVPEWIIVHDTGGTAADPLADTSHHTFEIVDTYHKSLGWEGFGYHFFIDILGKITVGRAENYHGAHTKGYNTKSIGICLAGNFDLTMPTAAQTQALSGLLKGLRKRYLIPRENIVPHRRFAAKTCYGKNLADDWAAQLADEEDIKGELITLSKKLSELIYKL